MSVKILIFEDNPEWQKTLEDFIKDGSDEYDVEVEEKAFLVFANRLVEKEFDLIISDYKLNEENDDENGLEVIKAIKKRASDFPSIIVTLYPNDDVKHEALNVVGVDAFLNKVGLTGDILMKAVRDAMERRKRTAFMIMPFLPDFNEIWTCIQDGMEQVDLEISRVDSKLLPGPIIKRIYKNIEDADYIVADLTGKNPNVLHELGYAHAYEKIVITLTQNSKDVPRRLQGDQYIRYSANNWNGDEKLKEDLKQIVNNIKNSDFNDLISLKRNQSIKVDPNLCLVLAGEKPSGGFKAVIDETDQDVSCNFLWEQDIYDLRHELGKIWQEMQSAAFCVADLGAEDPIVYYLTGLAIGLGKNLILLKSKKDETPFDFRSRSSIQLTNSYLGIRRASKGLIKIIKTIQEEYQQDEVSPKEDQSERELAQGLAEASNLRELLNKWFNKQELKEMVFELGGDFESITSDQKVKTENTIDTIEFYKRRGKLVQLSELMIKKRPDVPWDDEIK